MKMTRVVLGLIWAMGFSAWGQSNPVITSFQGNGILEWTHPTNGVGYYRLEWASQANGPWTNFTGAALMLNHISPTGETMRASVPMFYRVAMSTNWPDYLVVDLAEGPEATNYPVTYLDVAPEGGWGDEYKTTKLVLRRIPAGTFTMGSPTNELGRLDSETEHPVTLTKDFYIGVFEVTEWQWERVMGTWPSVDGFGGSNQYFRPVNHVTYNDIRGASAGANWPADNGVDTNSFMGQLRSKTSQVFDLPTEAQWEYACRAGTSTALNSGYNLTNTLADARMDEVGWYWNGDFMRLDWGTMTVGSYLPNAWGLYDMHGNVLEWCLDWAGVYLGSATDPKGSGEGTYRILRGGGWRSGAASCRSAIRWDILPATSDDYFGLRVALTLP